jgi:hypothetical protein
LHGEADDADDLADFMAGIIGVSATKMLEDVV